MRPFCKPKTIFLFIFLFRLFSSLVRTSVDGYHNQKHWTLFEEVLCYACCVVFPRHADTAVRMILIIYQLYYIYVWFVVTTSVSSGQSFWLQIQRSGFDSRGYQIFWLVGLEWGSLSLVSKIEELLVRKSSGSGLEIRKYSRRDPSHWARGILCPQKLALKRSVGIVRSRTQATEFMIWGSYCGRCERSHRLGYRAIVRKWFNVSEECVNSIFRIKSAKQQTSVLACGWAECITFTSTHMVEEIFSLLRQARDE
jgi:hypothetical protein